MAHKLYARPKSDKDAKPFEITVSDHTCANVEDAKAHVAKTCPTLVVVGVSPSSEPAGPTSQAVEPDGTRADAGHE